MPVGGESITHIQTRLTQRLSDWRRLAHPDLQRKKTRRAHGGVGVKR